MSFFSAVHNRLSSRDSSRHDSSTQSSSVDRAPSDPVAPDLPFAGYDRLGERQVMDALSGHSQVELEAVESYERSHQNRAPVLNKLRWMRGREPFAGYDALDAQGVVAALGNADLATIKKVRAYERKFAKRHLVLEEVVRVHHRRLASQPAAATPHYQPISASAMAASARSRGARKSD